MEKKGPIGLVLRRRGNLGLQLRPAVVRTRVRTIMSAKPSQNYFELLVVFSWGVFSPRPFNVGRVDHNRYVAQARGYFPTLKGRDEKAPLVSGRRGHTHRKEHARISR